MENFIFCAVRSSHLEVFLERCILKICSKLTGEHPCRSVNCNFICSFIDLLCNFIEVTFRHGCSPVNLPHIFRTPFTKNTSGQLLLCSVINEHFVLQDLNKGNFMLRPRRNNVEFLSTFCNVENPMSNFASSSTSDQRYPQCRITLIYNFETKLI